MKLETTNRTDIVGAYFYERHDDDNHTPCDTGRIVMPLELCNIPGLIKAQTEYTMSRARYPNIRTSTLGALAMVSFAAARGYRTERNSRTPIYLVATANSGAGKDEPRKVNNDIAFACGATSFVGDTIASGEGLEDFIMAKGKILLQNDEFDTLLNAINKDNGGTKETLVQKMLSIYSSSGSFMSKRKKSTAMGNNNDGYVVWPSLTLYASAVPDVLYKAFSERSMANGFVARCLIADCGVRQPKNPHAKFSEVPKDIIKQYQVIFGCSIVDGHARMPDDPKQKRDTQTIVGYSCDALDLAERKSSEWDERYHSIDNEEGKTGEQSMYARTDELVERCAMCYAISENPCNPIITVDAVNWAAAFVEYCQSSTLRAFGIFNSRNEFDENMKRVMRMFSTAKRMRTKREISRGLRLSIDEVEDVLKTLVANGELSVMDDGNSFSLPQKCHIKG